jgi:hypothetical protein
MDIVLKIIFFIISGINGLITLYFSLLLFFLFCFQFWRTRFILCSLDTLTNLIFVLWKRNLAIICTSCL